MKTRKINRSAMLENALRGTGYSLRGIMQELHIPLSHYQGILYNFRYAQKYRQSRFWRDCRSVLKFIGLDPEEFFKYKDAS